MRKIKWRKKQIARYYGEPTILPDGKIFVPSGPLIGIRGKGDKKTGKTKKFVVELILKFDGDRLVVDEVRIKSGKDDGGFIRQFDKAAAKAGFTPVEVDTNPPLIPPAKEAKV